MTLSAGLSEFATEVGADVKALYTLITGAANITNLQSLDTNTKANLIAAINEVFDLANAAASSGGAVIDDNTARTTTVFSSQHSTDVATAAAASAASGLIADGVTAGNQTWSSTKINTAIGAVASQVQTILAGSSSAYDTFKEVSDYIASDTSGAAAMLASIQNRIQVDADQTFTSGQITQGLANLVKLGVAKQADLTSLTTTVNNLVTAVGDTTVDLVGAYTTAKNS